MLTDGKTEEAVCFDRKTGNAEAITLTYSEPVEASGVAFQISGGDYWLETVELKVELSEDGESFAPALSRLVVLADSGDVDTSVRTFAFDRRRRFRRLRARFSFGTWGRYHDFRLGELAPASIRRICRISGTALPQRFVRIVERFGSDPEAMKQAGIAYATEQIIDLFANGVRAVHVYSMNKPDVARAIRDNLSAILK